MFAALPMHDWNGVRPATDALWIALRDRLRGAGIAAPETLTRPFAESGWESPDMLLAQTCGMPYRLWLRDKVSLLGAPDYGVEGCPPGFYRSHVIARPGGTVAGIAAVNALHSQSGYAALLSETGPPAHMLLTGAHEASIMAVASGQADYAAIDAVSWRHALRDLPQARMLTVAASTRPTPGLPFISALRDATETMQACIETAITALPAPHRDALFLRGFVRFRPEDYR